MDNASKIIKNLTTIVFTVIGLAIVIAIVVAVIKAQTETSDDGTMSIDEAQKKCVVLTMVGYQKATGTEQNVQEAQKHCLAMWDSPEREKTFKEYVEKEWENNKDEVFNGKTIETIYEERKASL